MINFLKLIKFVIVNSWRYRLTVRTSAFQAENQGPIPCSATNEKHRISSVFFCFGRSRETGVIINIWFTSISFAARTGRSIVAARTT